MNIRFRPLETWTTAPGAWRSGLRMPGKLNYPLIVKRFETELSELKASNIWIESGHDEDDLRLDGHLKQDAKPPRFPGVIVRLHAAVSHGIPGEARKPLGPLRFQCHTYDDWQANLWAVAMTMERLRSIAGYGTATESAIYALFADDSPQASPPGEEPSASAGKQKRARPSPSKKSTEHGTENIRFARPVPEDTTKLEAARTLLREAAEDDDPQFARIMLADAGIAKRVYVAATMKAHPDLDGTDNRMRTVTAAWAVLSGG